MADSVGNVARMLSVLAGPDPLDPRQRGVIPERVISATTCRRSGRAAREGLRVGVLREGFGQTEETWPEFRLPGSEPAVDEAVRAAVRRLEGRGAAVTEVSVPEHYHGLRIWFAIAAEGATEFMLKSGGVGTGWLGFYDTQLLEHAARAVRTRQNDYPLTVKNVLLLGEYLKRYYHGTYYAKAQNQRRRLTEAYDAALGGVDVLVPPTIPHLAVSIPSLDADFGEYMSRALSMINNTPQFNVTGHPAISVPCGVDDELPIGFMIVGRHFDDLTVLKVANALEKSADWRRV